MLIRKVQDEGHHHTRLNKTDSGIFVRNHEGSGDIVAAMELVHDMRAVLGETRDISKAIPSYS